jgi:hypothetical protein
MEFDTNNGICRTLAMAAMAISLSLAMSLRTLAIANSPSDISTLATGISVSYPSSSTIPTIPTTAYTSLDASTS